jgi:hypothetical protein
MFELLCDAGRRSLLVQRNHRIVGELVYQIDTDAGSCSANQIRVQKRGDRLVASDDILGPGATPLVTVEDTVLLGEDALEFSRIWTVHSRSVSRLSIDYRIRTTGSRVAIFPGVRYHYGTARTPVPQVRAPLRELTTPGIIAGNEEEVTALILNRADSAASFELRESDGMPAITISVPVSAAEVRVEFLLVPAVELHRALASLVQRGWRGTGSTTTADRLREYLRAKPRHLEAELLREPPNVTAVVPGQDRGGLRRATAYRPFFGLAAAHAFALAGNLSVSLDTARFFLQGKRQDGALCDVYDRERRKWGSHAPNFTAGEVSELAMADAAYHLSEIDRLLTDGGRQHPEIGRAVSDVVSHLIENETEDRSAADPLGPVRAFCGVVTVLATLRRQRGKNSVRSAALRRLGAALIAALDEPGMLIRSAARRDDVLAIVRACNDLRESGIATGTSHAVATWLLASWFYARALGFPRRSPAGRLAIDTAGLGVVSEIRRHLDFEGLPVAVELVRAEACGAALGLTPIARAVVSASIQATSSINGLRSLPDGAQPAELDHLGWSSRGRRGKPGQLLRTRIGQSSHAIIAAHAILERYPQLLAEG